MISPLRSIFITLCVLYRFAAGGWLVANENSAPGAEEIPAAEQSPTKQQKTKEEPSTPKAKKDKKKAAYVTVSEDGDKPAEVIEEKDVENYRLANPGLMEKYLSNRERSYATGEHLFANLFVGAFSGASFGALGSLAVYDSKDTAASREKLIAFSGGGAIAGVLSGALVTWFEYRRDEQFTIGPVLMSYTWYGAIGGALAGMAVGLIPYGSSRNTDDILHYTGYGALAGVGLGTILFLFHLPENLDFAFLPSERGGRLALTYHF